MSLSRSTLATIINNTSLELTLQSSIIGPDSQGKLQAESAGLWTGDEGSVYYSSPAGTFYFQFDNPYSGSNSYDESAPAGYKITRSGGGGDNAAVTWIIGT
ncbi:hypothetical protein NW752_000113 [Fusarium irregulare]|nr:hypothetical protein NW752_000113 [Fusarium irregulare]